MSDEEVSESKVVPTRRPKDDSFRQQRMSAWQPLMTPLKVVAAFLAIGISFVPTGVYLLQQSSDIYEDSITYDGSSQEDIHCSISKPNQGILCPNLKFTFDKKVTGPVYVYYQLSQFYQNHRLYVKSYNADQLKGVDVDASVIKADCTNSYETNTSKNLNPCGLIANSFFNDEINLNSALSKPTTVSLDENDISWHSDRSYKFKQVDGFSYAVVKRFNQTCTQVGLPNGCKNYLDSATGVKYKYFYPRDDKVQYLHETYPNSISPIDGVMDEHFIVWMRTAGLPNFRKLYGKISGDFNQGDYLVFNIVANFEVSSFSGSKTLVISTLGPLGGRNPGLGIAYLVAGSLCILLAIAIAVKHIVNPRPMADISDIKI